jgi:hypothetical protein
MKGGGPQLMAGPERGRLLSDISQQRCYEREGTSEGCTLSLTISSKMGPYYILETAATLRYVEDVKPRSGVTGSVVLERTPMCELLRTLIMIS